MMNQPLKRRHYIMFRLFILGGSFFVESQRVNKAKKKAEQKDGRVTLSKCCLTLSTGLFSASLAKTSPFLLH